MSPAGRRLVPLLVALQLAGGTGACAANPERQPAVRAIRGVVRVAGNEPFTHTVVTTSEDGKDGPVRTDFLVSGPLAESLRAGYQGKTVILEGSEIPCRTPMFRRCFLPTRILDADGDVRPAPR